MLMLMLMSVHAGDQKGESTDVFRECLVKYKHINKIKRKISKKFYLLINQI
jgi:hypothetical protein